MKRIIIIKPTLCARDEHEMFYYPRKGFSPKPELQRGLILEVSKEWRNLYGSYYRCETLDGIYDIPVLNAKEIKNP